MLMLEATHYIGWTRTALKQESLIYQASGSPQFQHGLKIPPVFAFGHPLTQAHGIKLALLVMRIPARAPIIMKITAIDQTTKAIQKKQQIALIKRRINLRRETKIQEIGILMVIGVICRVRMDPLSIVLKNQLNETGRNIIEVE